MEQPTKYSSQRPAGREHIPLYPRGFVIVRILQLIFGLICLALSGYGIAYLVFAGDALTLFTSIATLISSIYCLVARFGPPNAYNYWAILGLDIFLLLFWLISFAVLAAQIAPYITYYSDYSDYYDGYYSYYSTYDAAYLTYLGVLAGAAGIGGIEFILYIVSLSIHSVRLHRHRKAGLHCMPLGTSGPGGEKIQMQPQSLQPQPFQPQPQPQQPYPQPAHIYPNQGNFPQQNMYAAPQQNMYPQHQQQQVASPISSQPTGSSYVQGPPVSLNNNQPVYEAHGDDRQQK
ncbi:hypothetical protein MGN70_005874 [Eutypa lata]|nr:hypothetical protein MGN70_005874 [Eutypa lata]